MDESLQTIAQSPAGGVLLFAMGLGLIASGVYEIGSFRYQRIERT